MQHDLRARIREQPVQHAQVGQRQRVDDVRARAGRQLDQADAIVIPVIARCLRVHRDQRRARERLRRRVQRGLGLNVFHQWGVSKPDSGWHRA